MNTVPDYILFPINNIFELAEAIANLSDEGYEVLQNTLDRDYGFRIEKKHIHTEV